MVLPDDFSCGLLATRWQTWSPAVSVMLATGSLLVALSSRRTSRKALRLSERQETRREPRLDLTLNEAISVRASRQGKRTICADLLAVNPTDRDGSVLTADLHVCYRTSAGVAFVVKVAHDSSGVGIPKFVSPMELPLRLPANDGRRVWAVFQLGDDLLGGGAVDGYEIVLHDARGVRSSVSPWILKDMTDD